MAQQRTKIPDKIKEQLRQQAGGKCANPGCNAIRTHIHHINHWAVYQTHDAKHMIAVCPNCHDAIHHGQLPLSDEDVYRWKWIIRVNKTVRSHLFIEPGKPTKVLVGSVSVLTHDEAEVFQVSMNNKLKFRIVDGDILMLDLKIISASGNEILRVIDNHIKHEKDPLVEYKQIPGQIQIVVPNDSKYVPKWVIEAAQKYEPGFGTAEQIPIVHIEVIRDGVVRMQGIWIENEKAIVCTSERLVFCRPNRNNEITGAGEETILRTSKGMASFFGFENSAFTF